MVVRIGVIACDTLVLWMGVGVLKELGAFIFSVNCAPVRQHSIPVLSLFG